MKKKGLFSTKEVALCGVLAALCIVTNTFAIETPLVSITFTYLICFMAGHFFGPLVGFTVGTIGDVVGCFARGYAPNPLIWVGSMMIGLLPGIVQFLFRLLPQKKTALLRALSIVVSYILVYVLITVFWNTYALWESYFKTKQSYWAFLSVRIPTQTLVWGINLAITFAIYPIITRALRFKPISIWDVIKDAKARKSTATATELARETEDVSSHPVSETSTDSAATAQNNADSPIDSDNSAN